MTREEWLNKAVVRLNEMIAEKTELKPSKKVLVSVGFPQNDRKGAIIGQCWPTSTGSGKHHIFITPREGRAVEVLDTLLHELVHAADNCENQHKGPFVKAVRALGLEGKPTATFAGKELRKELKAIAAELGKYPHTRLSPLDVVPKQTTRMLKVECPECGCVVRMTRKWLDEAGAPTCACGNQMEESA